MNLTDEEIYMKVAANEWTQVADEIENDIWVDISGPVSLGMLFNIIVAPICLVTMGPAGLVPIVLANLYFGGKVADKVKSYTPKISYLRITDAILSQYEEKLNFPSRDLMTAMVSGDFDEARRMMAEFKTPKEEDDFEEKLLKDVEAIKELTMYG